MTDLDLAFVRQQFPAFAEADLAGTAFFENAGGSYMCRQVMDRFDTYLRQCKLQPWHLNRAAQKAGAMMDESYGALAGWMNVPANHVHFGPSTSQHVYVLAQAVTDWLDPGDEIIVTNQDHEANSGAWRRLARQGFVIREWQVDPETGSLSVDDLKNLITPKTRLLAFSHCSNILGEINPVADICALARQHDIRTVVDGVSYAGHGLPDCSALGADVYLYSLYKVFGPHQGVMVIRPDMAALLGNQGHYFNADQARKTLLPAGPDHAQIAASKGVADYFDTLYQHHFPDTPDADPADKAAAIRALLHQAEQSRLAQLLTGLNHIPGLRILGPREPENRTSTIAVTIKGRHPDQLCETLDTYGILAGTGHFYSLRLLEAMGLDGQQGVLRFSMAHYTSAAEVTQLLDALHACLGTSS